LPHPELHRSRKCETFFARALTACEKPQPRNAAFREPKLVSKVAFDVTYSLQRARLPMPENKQKNADKPEVTEAADVTGQEGLSKIKSVDLSLHGDGIDHWQDEPQETNKIHDKDREQSK
jgi:hypothetical protein